MKAMAACTESLSDFLFIIDNNEVLLIQESEDDWWALPGGGIDHGETVKSAMYRELQEELGVSDQQIHSDFEIAHYNIGSVVNGVPRMNIYIKVNVRRDHVKTTAHIKNLGWSSKDDFMNASMNQSYDKTELAAVIFDSASK
jgi:8-oxo-dGTP pyrophosphatase MutT (NUDIX family)